MTDKNKVLGVSVADQVQTAEAFGNVSKERLMALDRQLKGIGGTLHITKESDLDNVSKMAWSLSAHTGLPVIVVIRAGSATPPTA